MRRKKNSRICPNIVAGGHASKPYDKEIISMHRYERNSRKCLRTDSILGDAHTVCVPAIIIFIRQPSMQPKLFPLTRRSWTREVGEAGPCRRQGILYL